MKRLAALAQRLIRFKRARYGAVAVEFALLAIPFFWLTIGLAEITMIGFAQTNLDFAMAETARSIRTGAVQAAGQSEQQFQTAICARLNSLMTMHCANLYLDVDSYEGFIDVRNASPVAANGSLNTAQFGFSPGDASDIVLVRGFYRWEVLTPLFQDLFSNVDGSKRLLTSTILFRNEPF